MIVIKNIGLRKLLRYALPFAAIPIIIAIGTVFGGEKSYAIVSLSVALLAVLLFASGYDNKKTGTRRLVLVSIMTALSVVGRFIPFFKPVTALTIITAVYLGGEAGFLVGALSAAVSNFYFGQGPWTPFQMLAWGMIGLVAGFLSKPLEKSRTLIVLYGVLSGIVFSLIMDIWTVLWYNSTFDSALYIASLVTALPHTVLYAVSNAVFLWLFAKPFGEKLKRIKLKYGV